VSSAAVRLASAVSVTAKRRESGFYDEYIFGQDTLTRSFKFEIFGASHVPTSVPEPAAPALVLEEVPQVEEQEDEPMEVEEEDAEVE
jgi:hypothetical protein